MCGICGIVGRNDKDLCVRMARLFSYRGPDDEGYYSGDNVEMGMRRLSIIDLKGGHQPILNEDGTVAVVVNGEIYNYKEMRKSLEGCGHRFSTDTDSEVVVHLYEEYGLDFPRHMDGMFSIGLWDSVRRRFIGVRDRLGIKPFYYSLTPSGLVFSSEYKSILLDRDIPRDLDYDSIAAFLNIFMFIPGERTMIKGIKRLLPGHMVVHEADRVELKRYWKMSMTPEVDMSIEDAASMLENALYTSVKERLMSDVPLGTTLSGGIDSAMVLALMSRAKDEPVKAFTVGFGERDAEFDAAAETAEIFGAEHYKKVISPKEAWDVFPKVIWHQEDLSNIGNEIPTYFFSRLASEHVTVFLVGEGSDELFAGYKFHRFFADGKSFPLKRVFNQGTEYWDGTEGMMRGMALTGISRTPKSIRSRVYLSRRAYESSTDKDMKRDFPEIWDKSSGSPYNTHFAPYLDDRGSMLNRSLLFGMEQTIPHFHCTRLDKLSMAWSTEARVPFLDHQLVELSGRIPPWFKVNGLVGKYVLKKVASSVLPHGVLKRKKLGLSTPLISQMEEDVASRASQRLLGEARPPGVPEETVSRMLTSYVQMSGGKREGILRKLFTMLMYEEWHRQFILEE